jgi:hypothetical protein
MERRGRRLGSITPWPVEEGLVLTEWSVWRVHDRLVRQISSDSDSQLNADFSRRALHDPSCMPHALRSLAFIWLDLIPDFSRGIRWMDGACLLSPTTR